MGIISTIATTLNFYNGHYKIRQITKIENSSYCVSNYDIKYQPDGGQRYELTPSEWKAFLFIFFRKDPDFYLAELKNDPEVFKNIYLQNKCYYDYFKRNTERFYTIFIDNKPSSIFLSEYALDYQDGLMKKIDPRRYAYNAYLINNFGLKEYNTVDESGSLKSFEYADSVQKAAQAVLSDKEGFIKNSLSKTNSVSLNTLANFLEKLEN
jgi:hypothetical protein